MRTLLLVAALLSAPPVDPLLDSSLVTVPPASTPPRTIIPTDPASLPDLASVAPEDPADLTDPRTWYNASLNTSSRGLPLVRGPGTYVRAVPASRRPWSSTFWPSIECGLAFGGTYAYAKPYGLSPLEAYDTYVYNRTNHFRNPRSAFWEAVGESLGVDPRTGWYFHDLSPLWLYGPPPPPTVTPDPRLAERQKRDWFGHCNAWTAAAVLCPEPPQKLEIPLRHPLRVLKLKKRRADQWTREDNADPLGAYQVETRPERSLVLTRADLVGILTEAHMGATALDFTGGTWVQQQNAANLRARLTDFKLGTGLAGEGLDSGSGNLPDAKRPGTLVPYGVDCSQGLDAMTPENRQRWNDPAPHNLHLILLSTIGARGIALAGDVDANAQVDNHPIYGYAYKRNWFQEEDRQGYLFHARLRVATYRTDPQLAGTRARDIDCHFRVFLDTRGRILGSEWLGPSGNPVHKLAHIDQLWFPQGFTAGTFYGNRALDDAMVKELVRLYTTQSGTGEGR
jgi:hypothetical protein